MSFAGTTVPCTILLLLVLFGASPPCHGDGAQTHSISAILAASPDFGDFSVALAATNLTGKIDGRHTITVLAVDNAAVERLRARRLPAESLVHVLSLHVLLDYYDGAKLKAMNGTTSRTQAASLYQASGAAPGSAGIVSIAKGSDGRVSFSADAAACAVFYQKSVKESPYDIAVLQVSDAISSPAAEGKVPSPAPAPAPAHGKAPQPSPAPVAATAPAPVGAPPPTNHTAAPPPKQSGTPAPAPTPKPAGKPAPPPKPADTPADAPADDDQPPADEEGQHKNAAAGTAPWMVGVAVAAAVTAVVLLL